jgi:hypothetical protein
MLVKIGSGNINFNPFPSVFIQTAIPKTLVKVDGVYLQFICIFFKPLRNLIYQGFSPLCSYGERRAVSWLILMLCLIVYALLLTVLF